MSYSRKFRLETVEEYLKSDESLSSVAHRSGIHRNTLWRWVQNFAECDSDGISIHEFLVKWKEQEPGLTCMQASARLKHIGIGYTTSAIWKVWRKYALAGRPNPLPCPFGHPTPRIRLTIRRVSRLLEEGDFRNAASLINSLPSYPGGEVILRIPDDLLSSRRMLDKVYQGPQIDRSIVTAVRKLRGIRSTLVKEGRLYSAILAGLNEVQLYGIIGDAHAAHALSKKMKLLTEGMPKSVQFTLNIAEFRSHAFLGHWSRARNTLVGCMHCMNTKSATDQMVMGNAMTVLTRYSRAELHFTNALKIADSEDLRRSLKSLIAFLHAQKGDYHRAKIMFDSPDLKSSSKNRSIALAYCFLGRGDTNRSRHYLEFYKKQLDESIIKQHHAAYGLALACTIAAEGNHQMALSMLESQIHDLTGNKLYSEVRIRNLLITHDIASQTDDGAVPVHSMIIRMRLARTRYQCRKVLRYVDRWGIRGVLDRFLFLYPKKRKLFLDLILHERKRD